MLSNVDNESFSYTSRTLEVQFDGVMTAEDIGSYKPSARNFEYLIDRLASHGIRKDQILHAAQTLFHDHPGANKIGLASCWINRPHGKLGATRQADVMPNLHFQFNSTGELADAHRKARQG